MVEFIGVMVKTYKINIAGMERALTLCSIYDDLYIGAFIIVGDPSLSEHCARELLKIAPEFDYVLTAETKGIPLVHEMARQRGDAKYIVARKSKKLYMVDPFFVEVQSITTAARQKLYLDQLDVETMKGKKVLIVDDVISTGKSLEALEELAERCGANVVGKMAILAEGEAADRDDILFLEKLPLFNAEGEPIS